MNAYEKSIELGMTGEPEEIVAALRATGMTTRKIPLAELLFTLNNRNMLVRLIRPADTGEKWSGTLVNMTLFLNDNSTTDQAAAVNRFFSHITNDRNQFFDMTDPEFAAPVWMLAQSLAGQPTMPTAEDFAAVAALGGGWLFADLTVEEFATQKAAAEAFAVKQQLDSEWSAILNDGGVNVALSTGDRSGLKAALAAAIEVL